MTENNSRKLFESHLYLAKRLAKKYNNTGKHGIEFDDLHQEALIGLYAASKTYNNSFNVPFIPYAITTIKFQLLKYFRTQNYFYTPKEVVIMAGTINKRKMAHWEASEIALKLNVPVSRVKNALKHLHQPIPESIFTPISDNEPGIKMLIDILPTYNHFAALLTEIDIALFMKKLDARSSEILRLRLAGFTQYEIAESLEISQSLVNKRLKKIQTLYRIHNKNK